MPRLTLKNISMIGWCLLAIAVVALMVANGIEMAWAGVILGGISMVLWAVLVSSADEVAARPEPVRTRCLRCGYVLTGLPKTQNGTVQCPECGAEQSFDPRAPV